MLTYNDLYETLRKEKYSESLQNLPKNFIPDFSEYITGMRENFTKEEDLFMDSGAKNKKQLENSIAIFKELMLRRKKKLLNLVFVATETGIMKKDFENMLYFERDLFEKLIKSFEGTDKEISKVFLGKKEKVEEKYKMISFKQNVEQFVDMSGNIIGPFKSGELVNINFDIADILVSGGKASFVDED